MPGSVALKKGVARLPKPSVVNVTRIVTADKVDLEERIGRLPGAALESVSIGLRLVLEGAC